MSDCLELFASAYREAFEELKEAHPEDSFLGNFPCGCCSLSVETMCYHLEELGWSAEYTGGEELESDGSHSWVVCEGVVIDITADQFDGALPSVYVGDGLVLHNQYQDNEMEVRLDCYEPELIDMIRSKAEECLEAIGFNDNC